MRTPWSRERAPIPSMRRTWEKRLSAATSRRARILRPSSSTTSTPSPGPATACTPQPATSSTLSCPATDSNTVRRITWLGTSHPSRPLRPSPALIRSACEESPSVTLASRSSDTSAGSKRSHRPSPSRILRDAWVSAISRPSKAGTAMASSGCFSTTATFSPLPSSERAKHSPAGPAPTTMTSKFMLQLPVQVPPSVGAIVVPRLDPGHARRAALPPFAAEHVAALAQVQLRHLAGIIARKPDLDAVVGRLEHILYDRIQRELTLPGGLRVQHPVALAYHQVEARHQRVGAGVSAQRFGRRRGRARGRPPGLR